MSTGISLYFDGPNVEALQKARDEQGSRAHCGRDDKAVAL